VLFVFFVVYNYLSLLYTREESKLNEEKSLAGKTAHLAKAFNKANAPKPMSITPVR